MFKKSERLNRFEFTYFFKIGKKYRFPYFTITYYPSTVRKVAVVVSKKVAKSAVQRNLLKRRITAILYSEVIKNKFMGILIIIVTPPYSSLTRQLAALETKNAIAQVRKSA
ncbi:ribonuclease P protein component [Candidatus Kaiserbacteria bacterium]|nr:ribonuclease P protein component [Candidatus Kaiserbacteria bacterium]NCT02311.1 ribonuclease P protein component [Candidatus Parcubacteria bacterium]